LAVPGNGKSLNLDRVIVKWKDYDARAAIGESALAA
jgi:hypothetical protein